MKPSGVMLLAVGALGLVVGVRGAAAQETKNWILNGTFEDFKPVTYPWHGIDRQGFLRKPVTVPTTNPFVTKSNQFSYNYLGTSASFVDLDGDALPDLVSPCGAGNFWFWKNIGRPGEPAFSRGEVMPLLVDDQRSQFLPVIESKGGPKPEPKLSPAEQAIRQRIDDRRDREVQRLLKANERKPERTRRKPEDIRRDVENEFPYPTPPPSVDRPATLPPGGLACVLNTFRRLRAVAAPGDWNNDGLTDFLVGDSSGAITFCRNSGRPGQPVYGVFNVRQNRVPLKVVTRASRPGQPVQTEVVEFVNYAMPFVTDWNGNGTPDLLVGEGTYSVNAIRLFPDAARTAPGSSPRETMLYFGGERTFLSPMAYDWDGDGDLDLFVTDNEGVVTVHRNPGGGAALEAPEPLTFDAPDWTKKLLAYACPQPADWNNDGVMDLIWGDPYGRICVSLGREKGGLAFAAADPVRSTVEPETVKYPVRVSVAPAATDRQRATGGTADAQRLYQPNGRVSENARGWPSTPNDSYGALPGWSADGHPALEKVLSGESWRGDSWFGSFAVAPFPGDYTDVEEELSAPGEGKTLVVRFHDVTKNQLFRTKMPPVFKWQPGVSICMQNGRGSEPHAEHESQRPLKISFQMKLVGKFTRLNVRYFCRWQERGELLEGKNSPVVQCPIMEPPPQGDWFTFTHTEPAGELPRGLPGTLMIELLGEGEVRLRDVKCQDL